MERLDRVLSAGGWSRKEARALIRAGRAAVDGATVTDPGYLCAPGSVTADGARVRTGFTYVMLHKPPGVVSATADSRERTVLELLPEDLQRRGLAPVGRLDKDATGLLLLTDDGALAHALLSPRRHVDKVYAVTVEGTLTPADAAALAAGLTLGDGLRCLPAALELTDAPNVGRLTLREGKFHQVKRMMACLGKPVTGLRRVAMGPLGLDEALEPGQWRLLTEEEREALEKSSSK